MRTTPILLLSLFALSLAYTHALPTIHTLTRRLDTPCVGPSCYLKPLARQDDGELTLESCEKNADCRGSRRCFQVQEEGDDDDDDDDDDDGDDEGDDEGDDDDDNDDDDEDEDSEDDEDEDGDNNSDAPVLVECNDGKCFCAFPRAENEVPQGCEEDDDCAEDFVCAKDKFPVCVREEELERANVCIGVHHLGKFEKRDLVFSNHRLTRVLCDVKDSCATPGHMVLYRGKGMMMRSYCDVVKGGCETRVMNVNSPRWKRGLTIESKSDDLSFTAFAARWESKVEEGVLQSAIRVGL